jgi:peroxiredoxin
MNRLQTPNMKKHDVLRFAAFVFVFAFLMPCTWAQETNGKGAAPTAAGGRAFDDIMVESARTREPGEKIKLLRQAEVLCKDRAQKVSEIYPNLVGAYVAIADFENAARLIEQMSAQGASPLKVSDAQVALARGYLKAKRFNAASEQLNSAIAGLEAAFAAKADSRSRLQRSLLGANQAKGELLLEQGDAQAALDLFRECEERGKAIKDWPSALLKFDLARGYLVLKMNDDARTNFAEAYSQVAHRVHSIRGHVEVAGAPALNQYQEELTQLEPLLDSIKDQARPVIEAGASQESADLWLDRQLAQYELGQLKTAIEKATLNKPAPSFTLATLAGTRVKLSDLRGKVVLLDFWETSCKPCRAEYPHLKKIQGEMREAGAVVLMVSLDSDISQVKPFAEKNGFAEMVLLKDDSVNEKYGVEAMPHNVIIDQAGNIRFSEVGFTLESPQLFRAEIKMLLEAAKSSANK